VAHGNEVPFIEEITIVGQNTDNHQISGAAQYIGEKQLQEQSYSDIQRILRQSPGVSVQIEDGYGLRPNISIRGVATERSGRITLLEDNVLSHQHLIRHHLPITFQPPAACRLSRS